MDMLIEKLLVAWNLATIQMAAQINRQLKKHSKTWEDVEKYISTLSQVHKGGFKNTGLTGISCPKCKQPMFLYSVNTTRCNKVGGDYKSQWYCRSCDISIFNKLTVQEEIERVGNTNREKEIPLYSRHQNPKTRQLRK